jgi:predicted amidohydrolase YtcJ
MPNNKHLLFTLFFSLFLLSCQTKMGTTLIVHHAQIYTVDSFFSKAEAMAVDNGKVIAVGTNQYILDRFRSKKKVNAKGKVILPGFIDAHCHFTGFATDSWKCDLVGTSSFESVIDTLLLYAKKTPTEWIYGRGWDQNDWPDQSFPDKKQLDNLFPNRPVFLKRIDGHAALANQRALDIASITTQTKVEGGSIEIKNNQLTGILIDNAMSLVEQKIPEISDSLAAVYFKLVQQKCFSFGLTGVHDCGVSEHTISLVDREQRAGRLKMKIFALLTDSSNYYEPWIIKGPYITERLHVGGFKVYADGALGSRGACLLNDYSDQPHYKGFLLSRPDHFRDIALKLINSGFQMCTHAIGDSGNREILNIYAAVLKGKNDRRWRIEHAQVVDPADIHYFGNNNIIPSVQPTHATSDMYWAGERLGKQRLQYAYAYQQLLQENGWIALGTDFPVEDINPFKTFLAAVARKDTRGFPAQGFQIENALTRVQAIMGMTIWAAKAAFEENEKGSLEVGKAADFIILDQDLMNCDDSKILNTHVLATFINGEQVYEKHHD